MKTVLFAVMASALMVLPADLAAQSGKARGEARTVPTRASETRDERQGNNRWERNRRYDDRYDRRDRNDRNDRRYDDRYDRRGNGPPFCRNGQGHPVHGRQWCRDKGWDSRDRWERRDRDLGSIIFGRDDRRDGRLDQGSLIDILGRGTYGRLSGYSQTQGFGTGLTGHWASDGVLYILAGDTPIARLIDSNRDRRVDQVFLNRLR